MNYNPWSFYLLLCSLLLLVIVGIIWRYRATRGTQAFIGLVIAITVYTFGYSMELSSSTLNRMLFWNAVEYPGIVAIPSLWLAFILIYTNKRKWLTKNNIVLLYLIPFITVCIRWTNEAHHLFYKDVTVSTFGKMSILTFVRAPWYWIYAAFCFLSILSGVIILWYNRRNSAALYKTQTTYLLVAATVPFVVYGIYIANILPSKNFDINPFAFTFSAICICMGFLRHRLLDMSPVARDTLIENLPDGVVVLDMQNRVIDVNPSAMRIFGWTQPPTGLTAEHIWKSWPNLPGLFSRSEMAIVETQHNNPDGTEFCDVNYSLLKDSDGKPVGKVIIAHDITARKSIEHELQLSKETAESANEELRKAWVELAKSAETDYLTKSYNRRKFDEIVIVEMNRTSRYDTPLSLLMFDIDHFKLANDRYGHHAGDNLLVELVQFIKDHTRKPDILVRWGGEEFLLLTPGIALPQAVQLAEKLRGLIAAHVFSVLGTITISIGVTQYMSFDSSDSMVKRADDALYQAKANGRNCVVVGQVNVN